MIAGAGNALTTLVGSRLDLLKMPSPSWGRRLEEMFARDLLFRWCYLVRIELRPPTRVQINRTMTAAMTEPMIPEGWRKPSVASLWKIRYPRNPPHERTDDSEDDGHRNRQVLLAWNEEPRKCAGNESDDDARDNESKHGVGLSGSRAERRLEIGPVGRLPDADTVHHPYGGSEHTPREVILGDDFACERSDHRGDRRRLRRGGEGLGPAQPGSRRTSDHFGWYAIRLTVGLQHTSSCSLS